MRARPCRRGDRDGFDLGPLAHCATLVCDEQGEHLVLSNGFCRIRLDVRAGSLSDGEPVRLAYDLAGFDEIAPRLLTLRRLVALHVRRRFVRTLFPIERNVQRGITVVRVADALGAGASQREIAEAVFGAAQMRRDWAGRSDFLRSRVRRLVRQARHMSEGGYRRLLRGVSG